MKKKIKTSCSVAIDACSEIYLLVVQNLGQIWCQYRKKSKPFDFAMVIGKKKTSVQSPAQ